MGGIIRELAMKSIFLGGQENITLALCENEVYN